MKKEIDIAFIEDTLKFVCARLNENKIDYYVVGAIGAYIDGGISIQRLHDDIDIMVEEKCLDKIKNIFEDTDFEFCDNRFTSNKVLNQYGYTDGEHEVYAKYKDSDFRIGFFLFRRDNNSYTSIEYFREGGVQKRLERTLPIEFFAAQYNDRPTNFLGTRLKTVRKETVYKNKLVMKRKKDLFDIEKLESVVESDKLNKLKGLSQYRKTAIVTLA